LTIANGISSADRGGGLYNRSTGTVLLQRVTFRDNEADRGGGMFNWGTGDVTLEQVTFEANDAFRGGGMLNRFCNPTLTNVTFNDNTATGYGGGMHNNGSSPTLTDVVFSGNSATLSGGGLYNEGNSVPALTDVTLSENDAEYGGGMYNEDSSPTLTNVTISSNSAASDGGGIWNSVDSNPILTHVTISGNNAVVGGGLFSEDDPATPTLSNTILAGNTAVFGPDCYGEMVSGNYNLVGNPTACDFVIQANDQIGADPMLGPLADNGGETQTRALLIGSPAIDAIPFGVNGCGITVTSDQRGEDRPNPAGGSCDIGAYEYVPPVLPDTGFAPGALTALAEQPAEKAYTMLGDLWLELPDLGVQAPIVGVPFVGGGWDVSWLGSSAGYLPGSAFPTWPGNTVLTGHVWDAHNRPGIFVDLKQLRYDDRIAIHAWSSTYIYAVRESRLVAPQAVDIVMQHKEFDWVTLLTCEDYRFDSEGYIFRRMVRAVLVEVVPDR
jgi:LPXTG-site transpeptidase (sortase) family protein